MVIPDVAGTVTDTAPALSFHEVAFRYPATGFALAVPVFTLGRGERVLLRGPSGSGKTTFLGLATGRLAAASGRIEIAGRPMPRAAAARDRLRAEAIGVIHQQFNLLPWLGTLSNVLLPTAFGRDGVDAASARALLVRLGLPDRLHGVPARTLSVGQQQRVAIARALLGRPRLIVADEPTSALDPAARDTFLDLLFESAAAAGAGLLMVSHDPEIGRRFARVHDLADIARTGTGAASGGRPA